MQGAGFPAAGGSVRSQCSSSQGGFGSPADRNPHNLTDDTNNVSREQKGFDHEPLAPWLAIVEDDTEDDIRWDPPAWAVLTALVEAKNGLTQPDLQEQVGLGIVWTRRARQRLERWGLARSEERFEGRARYLVTFPTEQGRKAHKMRTDLDAFLLRTRETHGHRADDD